MTSLSRMTEKQSPAEVIIKTVHSRLMAESLHICSYILYLCSQTLKANHITCYSRSKKAVDLKKT